MFKVLYGSGFKFDHTQIVGELDSVRERIEKEYAEGKKLDITSIAMKIKAWLDYKYDPDFSRFDFIKDRVEDFDEYLDDMENEENIYYGCPSIEEELFDDYKMFIDEMDLE